MSAIGGTGPAVVLLHGYGETGDMWSPLAARAGAQHTVIVPDLRGMGLSARPRGGYDKKTQGHDIAGVLDALKIEQGRPGHARHRQHGGICLRRRVSRAGEQVRPDRRAAARRRSVGRHRPQPRLWHFSFWGPDAERLVAGRERIYLDRFWNEFSADPKKFPEASRAHYAKLYAQPGAMHAGFEQFKAFDQDAIDNKAFVAKGKLTMPVLAVGGEKSFGPKMADGHALRRDERRGGGRASSGHWVMEENPAATSPRDRLPRQVTPENGEQFHNPWPTASRTVARRAPNARQRRSVARPRRRGAAPSRRPRR